MSLVGSLGDLGLGDILQIVSLSRKSGLLMLRSDEGEGRIVFCDGLVRAAQVKGEAEGLKELLVSGGLLDEAAFERAAEAAASRGEGTDAVLAEAEDLSTERLDSLRREHVERCVYAMFGWSTGEFSFEIREEVDDRDSELMISTGVNAQYLMMEATRLGDEGDREIEDDEYEEPTEVDEIEFGTDGVASAESIFEEPEPASALEPTPEPALAPELALEPTPEPALDLSQELTPSPAPDVFRATDALAQAAVRKVEEPEDIATGAPALAWAAPAVEVADETEGPEAGSAESAGAPPGSEASEPEFGSAIMVDADLTALEWQRSAVGGLFTRVHIFQGIDAGISRLRQYLRRGEKPVMLISSACSGDPMNGIPDRASLIRRIRGHAPNLSIFVVCSGDEPRPKNIAPEVGCLRRPVNHQLANRRAWDRFESERTAIHDELRNAMGAGARAREASASSEAAAAESVARNERRLERVSDRLRDPSAQGEVLALIVEFAAASYARVAVFMIRDDTAQGMIQSGLGRADGPGDEAFRGISLAVEESAWLSAVLEGGRGIKAPPTDAGDQKLAALLGSQPPSEAYLAPIESGGHVVAVIYVDNLPAGPPIGDTSALEIVVREAGEALDRALVQREAAGSGP